MPDLKRIPGIEKLWANNQGDPTICIAVLDGLVDQNHPCFAGASLTRLPTLVQGEASVDGSMSTHGTHVASIIFGQPGSPVRGIVPKCRGIIAPIFRDESLKVSQLDLARAIEQAVSAGAHIINISGGQLTDFGEAEGWLEKAVQLCKDSNVLIVAAAGNDGCECLHVIDTSVSMKNQAEGLSNAAEAAIKKASSSCPSDLRVEWFGLEGTWKNTNFQQTLRNYLMNTCKVAESEIRGRKRGELPGGGAQEDGARAIEDISTHFNWRDGASRAIFYLSDEALEGGDDTEQEDIEAANRAIEKAKSAGATVHTYFGPSKSKGRDKTAAEFARVAQETGGQAFTDKDAMEGFAEILTQIICVSSDSRVEETGQLIPVVPLYFAAVIGGALVSQSTQMSTVQPTNPTASVTSTGGLFSLNPANLVAAPQSSISTTAVNMPIYMMAVQPTNCESDRAP